MLDTFAAKVGSLACSPSERAALPKYGQLRWQTEDFRRRSFNRTTAAQPSLIPSNRHAAGNSLTSRAGVPSRHLASGQVRRIRGISAWLAAWMGGRPSVFPATQTVTSAAWTCWGVARIIRRQRLEKWLTVPRLMRCRSRGTPSRQNTWDCGACCSAGGCAWGARVVATNPFGLRAAFARLSCRCNARNW